MSAFEGEADINADYRASTATIELRADLNALRQVVNKVAGDGTVIDLPPLSSLRGAKLN